jgi:hypothetical protein
MIRFGIPVTGVVSLRIMDLSGKTLAAMPLGLKKAGYHAAEWNAKCCPTGLYICRMETAKFAVSRSMMIMR